MKIEKQIRLARQLVRPYCVTSGKGFRLKNFDHKWFARLVVAGAIGDALASLDLQYPQVTPEQLQDLAGVRKRLLQEK